MLNVAQHTIYLQDGTLCNFKKRVVKEHETLLEAFSQVTDGRKCLGKRHELSLVLLILFGGITSGSTTLKDCHLWAVHNKPFLVQFVSLMHGIPDPTTISRAMQKVAMDSLVRVYGRWQAIISGKEAVASFDGKTLNGVHGKEVIKHVLSLFTHEKHQILAQVGVLRKENEIPAARRLFAQVGKETLSGMLLIGDALHTQKETANKIMSYGADYLFVVKENQKQLHNDLAFLFTKTTCPRESATEEEYGHNRYIHTEVTQITDKQVITYFTGWKNLSCVGRVQRTGTRTEKGRIQNVNDTVYFISSKKTLTAKEAAKHLREHWQIENNLHWQKDYTFLEDRQTLRRGNAPQVMTFLRSMCISLFATSSFASVTTTIANFQKNPSLHHLYLKQAAII